MIKGTLSLSHSDLIPARVHANVRRNPVVETELHPSQPLPDALFGDAELASGDAPVVVAHAEPVVAHFDCCAARAAADGDAAASFAGFAGFAAFGGEPVVRVGGGGEGADGG
jgi:hypothetical protein